MKKIHLFLAFFFFIGSAKPQDSLPGKPQEGIRKHENSFIKKLFIKVYWGDGLFTPGSFTVSSVTSVGTYFGLDTSVKSHAKRGIGRGPRAGIGIGLIQNDFLNIGIDAEFQPRGKIKNALNTRIPNSSNYATAYDELSYAALTLTPYVIFKALARPKFFIYNKIGVMLTLPFTISSSGNSTEVAAASQQTQGVTYVYGDPYFHPLITFANNNSDQYDKKDKMSLGLGLNIAFGINFRINSKLRAFGEIFGNYSALTPKSTLSSTISKESFSIVVDTTNFHKEYPSKNISYTTNYITYNRGGTVGFTNSQYQNLGVDSEGYLQQKATGTSTSRKYDVNMAVVGINVGIIYRF